MSLIKNVVKYFTKRYVLNKRKYLYNYLYKYTTNIIVPKEDLDVKDTNPEFIWIMWLQGTDHLPAIVKKCINSVKQFHSDKKIIILDKNTINAYIDIPDYIEKKYQKGIISNAHYADYIRVCLLTKYGGLWIDSTVLLSGKIPCEIFKSDFYIYKGTFWAMLSTVPSKKLHMKYFINDSSCGSNWFIYSVSHCPILHYLKQSLERYWQVENKAIDYFFFHYLLNILLINNRQLATYYEKSLSISNVVPHLLYNVLYDDFDSTLYREIKNITPIHKLTYKLKEIPKGSFAEYLLKEDIDE